MIRYTAKMEHNSKTIEKLVETQQRVFQFGQRVGYMLISALLIIYGLYADKSMYTSYLALFAGCVMVTGLSFNTKRHAQALVKQMEGNFPKLITHLLIKDLLTTLKEISSPIKSYIA